ncbi:MAG: hypothetical protein EON87_12955 [Brevundimonas sp.]|nr:MAG: hypothetical protein EON87_12955 [Brevundimonas sp.]
MKTPLIGAVAAVACALAGAATAQSRGDWVLSYYQGGAELYPATVESVSGSRVTLLWDDGTTSEVNRSDVRPYNWRVGTAISCKWTDGSFYPARIARMSSDGTTIDIVWTQDGSTARSNTGACYSAG